MKEITETVIFCVSVLVLGCASHGAVSIASEAEEEKLMLVEEGIPNAVLVVEADSEKSERAAGEIRKYVEKMSGAVLPLKTEGEESDEELPSVQVHVGHTRRAAGQGVPAGFDPSVRKDSFENEGYVLRTLDDSTLLVAGNNDGPYRGTVFAAFSLLEELGCRFYLPGEWGEVVPEQATIEVPHLDVETRPDFPVRHIWLSGWVARSAEERDIYYDDWSYKIGFSERRIYPAAADGFLAYLIPPDEYFEEHPEYFAMGRDGERRRGRTTRHTMLCLSNDEMYEEAVRNLELAFEGEKDLRNVREDGFGISPPDGMPYCHCEECEEASQNFQYPHYGKIDQPTQSEEYFEFAARLAREFPDKWVGTMAYSLREMPPQGVDLPDNIVVTHAPITTDVLHAGDTELWRRSQFMEILGQYREQTPHVLIYDYNPGFLTGLFVPERDVANMAINAPLYREMDIKGMRREGRKAFMQTWISYYVTAKLLWDADADVEAIKEDFYNTFFGPDAGPHVQAWWDACERVLGESTTQAHEDFLVTHLYDKDFTDEIHRHVEAALEADATEEQRERIEAFALIAENLEMFAAKHDAEKRMDYGEAAEAAERMVELKEELNEIYSFFISPCDRERRFFAEGRAVELRELEEMTDGTAGELAAELPRHMRFARDPFNEGVIERWYLPEHDDSGWDERDTYYLLEQQEEPLNEAGFHYDGYVWYRDSVDVPAEFEGRELTLRLGGTAMGGIINEGWVWVNGEYVGHNEHALWWRHGGHPAAFDVSEHIRAGEENHIAIRVLNDPDEMGGLYRRGFIYSPNE